MPKPPTVDSRDNRNSEEVRLADATPQEIQLELIRRNQFNAFDGEKIVRTLLAHKDLWSAVLLDRLCVWTSVDFDLPMGGMIKLRDLPKGYWNADTLYILTEVEKSGAL